MKFLLPLIFIFSIQAVDYTMYLNKADNSQYITSNNSFFIDTVNNGNDHFFIEIFVGDKIESGSQAFACGQKPQECLTEYNFKSVIYGVRPSNLEVKTTTYSVETLENNRINTTLLTTVIHRNHSYEQQSFELSLYCDVETSVTDFLTTSAIFEKNCLKSLGGLPGKLVEEASQTLIL